jgi:putative nucleotidyltransferase with HDIG domain
VKPEADFLIALGQVLSTAGLYGEQHPAYRSALDGAFDPLTRLLASHPEVRYSFLDGEVIFANRRLRSLRDWPWAGTLAERGFGRIEIDTGVDRAEFERFLVTLAGLLERIKPDEDRPRSIELPHVRAGPMALDEVERLREIDRGEESAPRPEVDEETGAVDHLFDQAQARGRISLAVARSVIHSISVVLQQGRPLLELLLPVRRHDEYTTVHSLNVSVLSMSLAEAVGVPRRDIRDIGEAALLHDLGKAFTPPEVLQKPDKLSPDDWAIVQKHPEDGARIIIRSGPGLEFAAVVAYEHHMTWQGGGYPRPRYPRRPHPVSQMVQVCDMFDALRTERPFRGPWPLQRILDYLRELSGTELNPDVIEAFGGMLARHGVHRPGPGQRNGRTESTSPVPPG